jgi:hypothetical protein
LYNKVNQYDDQLATTSAFGLNEKQSQTKEYQHRHPAKFTYLHPLNLSENFLEKKD